MCISERHSEGLFIAAVLSFILGIYVQTTHPFSLQSLFIALCVAIVLIPLATRKYQKFAMCLMIVSFIIAGMVRIGIVVYMYPSIVIDESKSLYEGIVIEASPSTKIVKIIKPESLKGLRIVFRTSQDLSINDTIRFFGELRELTPTFKNPYTTQWKWLKRLEGISYEVRGTLLSAIPGQNLVEAWRNILKNKIDSSGTKHGNVIKALTIGDRTNLEDDTKNLFLRTGTAHILAISGAHIGIITTFFFFIARFIIGRIYTLRLRGDHIRYASLLTIPFAFMFMLTAGSGIAIIRATIMITIYMFSLFFERGRHLLNTLALSALIILLLYPHSLFTPSFQLTFVSVLCIIIFTKKFYPLITFQNRIAHWFSSAILLTFSATVGTLPVVIYHFYGINPFSLIHNIIAVPLICGLVMPLSFIGLAVPLGEYILQVAGELLNITMNILTSLDFGYIFPIIRPSLPEIILYFICILLPIHARKKILFALFGFLIIPLIAGYSYIVYEQRFNNTPSISFIDVGIGDSMLIEGPKGLRILIDGGGYYRGDYDIGKSILTPILLSKKIVTLDYVVNTHPHGDHIGGLPYILKHFKVKHFATSYYFIKEEKFIDVLKLVKEKGIPLQILGKGDVLHFNNDFSIHIINPQKDRPVENLNNASLVTRIIYKDTSFLLTGDIESDIEEELILTHMPLKSNVLKIPHHGSKHSSSMPFLLSVQPDVAVLSVGAGIKGLPSIEAIRRYEKLSIPILRTDKNGFIQIDTDGKTIRYKVLQK